MTSALIEEYRKDVERIFGTDLVSLTLYGAHAADAPDPGHEVSVLIVLSEIRKETLEGYRTIAHRYAKRGIPPPPIFSESFLRGSADVFPVEFLGMAERHRVLSGRDVLADLSIDTGNLRHQVEFELKAKLLSLSRLYMETFGKKDVAELILSTVAPIAAVSRGLLLLADRTAPHGTDEIVAAVEKRFGVALPVLREALAARKAGKLSPARAEEIVFAYMEEVRALCALADRYDGAPGA